MPLPFPGASRVGPISWSHRFRPMAPILILSPKKFTFVDRLHPLHPQLVFQSRHDFTRSIVVEPGLLVSPLRRTVFRLPYHVPLARV